MAKNQLFADAVAEAKQLKETALAQAKLAMAESFAPRIQSMISSQLNEMEEEEEELSLEQVLKEMEDDDNVDYTMGRTDKDQLPNPPREITIEEEVEDTDVVAEISVEELKDVIRDVMAELNGEEGEEDIDLEDDENIDLDEILNEMGGTMREPSDNAAAGADEILRMIKAAIAKTPSIISKIKKGLEDAGSAAGSAMRNEAMDEPSDSAARGADELVRMIKAAIAKAPELLSKIKKTLEDAGSAAGSAMRNEVMREPSDSAAAGADEIVRLVKSAIAKAPELASKIMKALEDAGSSAGSAIRNEELQEATKTITSQSQTIKEMNLLNAKLLYVNKVFKAKNLNESQKTKVILAFDRAGSVKEVENTFKTIKESFTIVSKTPLKENIGRASQPLGSTRKPNLIVEDFARDRMMKLAGLK